MPYQLINGKYVWVNDTSQQNLPRHITQSDTSRVDPPIRYDIPVQQPPPVMNQQPEPQVQPTNQLMQTPIQRQSMNQMQTPAQPGASYNLPIPTDDPIPVQAPVDSSQYYTVAPPINTFVHIPTMEMAQNPIDLTKPIQDQDPNKGGDQPKENVGKSNKFTPTKLKTTDPEIKQREVKAIQLAETAFKQPVEGNSQSTFGMITSGLTQAWDAINTEPSADQREALSRAFFTAAASIGQEGSVSRGIGEAGLKYWDSLKNRRDEKFTKAMAQRKQLYQEYLDKAKLSENQFQFDAQLSNLTERFYATFNQNDRQFYDNLAAQLAMHEDKMAHQKAMMKFKELMPKEVDTSAYRLYNQVMNPLTFQYADVLLRSAERDKDRLDTELDFTELRSTLNQLDADMNPVGAQRVIGQLSKYYPSAFKQYTQGVSMGVGLLAEGSDPIIAGTVANSFVVNDPDPVSISTTSLERANIPKNDKGQFVREEVIAYLMQTHKLSEQEAEAWMKQQDAQARSN
jgi:hypothetical protein